MPYEKIIGNLFLIGKSGTEIENIQIGFRHDFQKELRQPAEKLHLLSKDITESGMSYMGDIHYQLQFTLEIPEGCNQSIRELCDDLQRKTNSWLNDKFNLNIH